MDLFDLFAKISLDTSEYEQGLDDASGKTSSFADTLGNGLAAAAKAGAAALTAAATAVASLAKNAVESYGEYEQLVGGVETLFGAGGSSLEEYAESAGKAVEEVSDKYDALMQAQEMVFDNASKAFETAGISANDYMETVAGFSAALIGSLENDTVAAAAVADQALIDMSDNANKMGSSMESIQNAYQGFAKQNYTMLDNLKLGYGGTKEEMQRLLEDAEALKAANGEMASYSIESFADIVEAIHVVQTEMGITGTTALEADETIQGSMSAMQAAWENLVTGMADDEQDFDQLINNFVERVDIAGQNLLPRIEMALGGIGKLVESMAPQIAEVIPEVADDILPSMLDAAASMISSVAAALPSLAKTITGQLPQVVSQISQVVPDMATELMGLLPVLAEAGVEIVLALSDGLVEALPEIIPVAMEAVEQLATTLTNPGTLAQLMTAAMTIVATLVESLIDAAPQLIDAAIEMVGNLVTFIMDPDNLELLISTAATLIAEISDGLMQAIPQLLTAAVGLITGLAAYLADPDNLELLVNTAIFIIETLSGALVEATPQLMEAATQIIIGLIDYIADPDNLMRLMLMAVDLVIAIGEGLLEAAVELVTCADELIRDIIDRFLDEDWAEVGKNVISGLWEGLRSKWEDLKSWWSDTVGGLIEKAQKVLGIASPSRVFKEIGKNMVEGLGIGWSDNIGQVYDMITASLVFDTSEGNACATAGAGSGSGTTTGTARSSTGSAQNDDGTMAAATAAQGIVELLAEALVDMATLEDELGTGLIPDPSFEDAAIEMIDALMDFLLHDEEEVNEAKIQETAREIIETLADGLQEEEALQPLEESAQTMIEVIREPLMDEPWEDIGTYIDDGIGAGIQAGWPWLEGLVAELAESLYAAACAALGIASPSRMFMRIGDYMAEGLGLGWERAFADVKDGVVSDLDFGTATLDTGVTGGGSRGYSLVQNIYAKAQSPAELLEESHLAARKAVFLGV